MKKLYTLITLLSVCAFHLDLSAQDPYPVILKNTTFLPPAKVLFKANQRQALSNNTDQIIFIQVKGRQQLNQLIAGQSCRINILDQLDAHTYTLSLPVICLKALTYNEGVMTIFDLPATYKLSDQLKVSGYNVKIKAKGCLYGTYDQDKMQRLFPDYLISEVVAFGQNTYFIVISDLSSLEKMAQESVVASLELHPESYTYLNFYKRSIEAVQGANASVEMGGLGLTGAGITIGHGDAGAFDHVDINDRVYEFAPKGNAIHASHTAATLIGAGNLQEKHKGMAYGARILNADGFDIITYLGEFRNDYKVHVTNNSYAAITKDIDCGTMGEYNIFSKENDESMVRYPDVLHVWASGNSGALMCDGNQIGYNSVLSGPQCAKNGITVGSIWRKEGTPVAEFSSQGPTDDGRMKPEIVAQGTNTTSAGASNNYYTTNGTSMSAPSITSTVAFMQENYLKTHAGTYPSSALLKAILVNTADDLFNEGPEFSNGFGKINTTRASRMAGSANHAISNISQEEQLDFTFIIPPGEGKAVVTLCWVDPVGNPLTTRQLVNDLDLELTGPDGIILPWVLDPSPSGSLLPAIRGRDSVNNLEQISFLNPTAGTYTIRIVGREVTGSQEFAICYRTEGYKVNMSGPFGGEKYLPGEFQYFQWECPVSNGNNFDISLSLDDGLSWQTIGTKSDSFRTLNYVMPQIRTDLGRIRVTHPTFGSDTSGRFTISPLPPNFMVKAACEGYANLSWSTIIEAVKYKIYKKTGNYMVEVAETTDTTYVINDLKPGKNELVSAAAVFPDGGIGRRALGQFVNAIGSQCPWANDLVMATLISPRIGRKNTISELTSAEQISVLIKNLGTADASGFQVYYNVGNGNIVEDFNGIIAAGSEQLFNFTIPVNFSNTGIYPITVGIVGGFDTPYTSNNILTDSIIQLENEVLVLTDDLNTTFKIDFETAIPGTYYNGSLGLSGIEAFDFYSSSARGRARTFVLTEIARSGNKALSLDAKLEGEQVTNDAIATFNLSSYNVNDNVRLDFAYLNHNNNDTIPGGSKVWIRGHENNIWIEAYDLALNQQESGIYKEVHSLNLSKLLKENGQDFSTSTQIKFTQMGNGPVIRRNSSSGYTFDDIYLHLVNNDIAITKIITPAAIECGLSNTEIITIQIENSDVNAVNNVKAWYRVNNGNINGPFDVGIIAGETVIQYSFPPVDLSNPGIYKLDAWINTGSDTYRGNDTLSDFIFINNKSISNFPYLESFEIDNGSWHTDGSFSSWEWGTPDKQIIHKAANDLKAWTTDLNLSYNPFERSYLVSPCFDLSKFTSDAMLSFSLIYDLEPKYDKVWMEISENGREWIRLGTTGEGINWYNAVEHWEGRDDQWHVASIPIPLQSLTITSSVQFRFVVESDESLNLEGIGIDDVHIFESGTIYTGENTHVINQTSTNWTDYSSGGHIIASIRPNDGQDLGLTDVGVFFNPDTLQRNDGNQYYLDRNFTIQPGNNLANGTVDVRLYFTDEEVKRSRNAIDTFDKPTTAYELGVTKITSDEDDGEFGNEINGEAQYSNFEVTDLIPFHNGYYIEFSVDRFSEFYINPGGPENNLPLGKKFISKINDLNNVHNLSASIYPNPAVSEVTLDITGLTTGKEVFVKWYNIFGSEVYRDNYITNSTHRSKIYNLPLTSGIYFIQISNNGHQRIIKLNRF